MESGVDLVPSCGPLVISMSLAQSPAIRSAEVLIAITHDGDVFLFTLLAPPAATRKQRPFAMVILFVIRRMPLFDRCRLM
jgi:hypothetical protein